MQHGPPSPSSNPGGLASAVREERCVDGEVGAGHRRPQRLQPLDAAPTLSPISPIAQRSILNLASGAIRSNPLGVHYSASKGGGVSMTPALARHGIRVNAIAPGLTDTAQPRYGNSEAELAENEGPERSARYPIREIRPGGCCARAVPGAVKIFGPYPIFSRDP
jgi:NAD(P)-dependent dehydrogenase (short-subunit alcohol dehydrogenase family)